MPNLASVVGPNVVRLTHIFVKLSWQFNVIFILPLVGLRFQSHILRVVVLELHEFTTARELRRWVHKVALNVFFGALPVNSLLVFILLTIHMFVLLYEISNIHLFKHVVLGVTSWGYLRYLSSTSWN